MKVIPDTIVIPLYHKIRFPFSEIRIILNQISGVIRDYQLFKNFDKMEWDCFLTEINDFKKEVLHSKSYKALGEVWNQILLGYLPRFLWRIVLYYSNAPIMELWADATEAQTNSPLINVIFYQSPFREYFKSIMNESCKEDLSSPGLYNFFRKSLDLE